MPCQSIHVIAASPACIFPVCKIIPFFDTQRSLSNTVNTNQSQDAATIKSKKWRAKYCQYTLCKPCLFFIRQLANCSMMPVYNPNS